MDRFIESWNIVSGTLQQRLQQESLKAGASSSGLFGGGDVSGDSSGGSYSFS